MLAPEQRKEIQGRFKIPVDSSCPTTYWIVSIDGESSMPTNEELAQIKSYIEFSTRRTYIEGAARLILGKPLPACPGHNTLILRKGDPLYSVIQGWFFRKSSWQNGPFYVPSKTAPDYRDLGLVEALDKYEDIFPGRWTEWKDKYPDIFPVSR